ncbi:MAG: YdcF family protein [Elainellaceae cyanobacterium]
MIDPTACPETTAGLWANFSWQTFDLFAHYKRIIVTLLTLAILPWVTKLPFKRWISGLSLATLALYIGAASPLATTVGLKTLTFPIPQSQADQFRADAIVVLGRGPEMQASRADAASELWHEGDAPRVFISGRGDAPPLIEQIAERGVPSSAVDGEPCSSTTEENAQYTAGILQPQGVKRIILVTDGPHMLRSLLTFRSLGFEATPYTTPLPQEVLSQNRAKFLIAREYFGLASYGIMGRFFPRTVAASTIEPPSVAMPTSAGSSGDSVAL